MSKGARRETPWLTISGDEAVIERWAPEVGERLANSAATELRVTDWQLANLDALIPYGRQFARVMIECDVSDLSALAEFASLQELSVRTGLNTIDFSRLQRLRSVSVNDDSPVFEHLHECRSLERLDVVGCGLRDFVPLSKLQHLGNLIIGEAPLRSLKGIENLHSLKRLALGQVPLERLDGIGAADELEEVVLHAISRLASIAELIKVASLKRLEIHGARKVTHWELIGRLAGLQELTLESVSLGAIDFASGLKELRSFRLQAAGKIPSLEPIRDLRHLERVILLEGTTIADGNTSLLLELPSLREAVFDNRPHYTTTREEIQSMLKERARTR